MRRHPRGVAENNDDIPKCSRISDMNKPANPTELGSLNQKRLLLEPTIITIPLNIEGLNKPKEEIIAE